MCEGGIVEDCLPIEKDLKIDIARGQFVDKVISLLEVALSQNVLSFTTARVMNYEEVQIHISYNEYCIVLGRRDTNPNFRPFAADHVFRICSQGEDVYWFKEPFVINDVISQDKFLRDLRDRLAALHNRLMKKEVSEDLSKLSRQLYEQNRFMRCLQDSLQ